ncbi:MAG TPA: hypothetical protein VFT55_04380 [Planctomycetota bacterium]|nr:hypothetical protein [Planctomycetota bacterium]
MKAVRTVLGSCLVTTVAAAQTTWIVDDTPGPGVHFTSLPAAVAAAASGDTLLVAPGSYEPFHVAGKSLAIFGAGNGATIIDIAPTTSGADYVAVASTPPGTTFRLAGLRIRRDRTSTDFHLLALHGTGVANSGTICLTDIVCEPAGSGTTNGGTGLLVEGVLVHAHRCHFRGGAHMVPLGSGFLDGDAAVAAVNAATFVADTCTLQGGLIPFAFIGYSGVGGPALAGAGGTGHVTRSMLRGGDVSGAYLLAGWGGAGMSLAGAANVCVVGTGSHSVRGGDGYCLNGNGTAGSAITGPAPAVVQVSGPVAVIPGNGNMPAPALAGGVGVTTGPALPAMSVTGTLFANGDLDAAQPVAVSVDDGPPGQLFVLLLDTQGGYLDIPVLADEPVLLTPAAGFAAFGLLDPLGHFGLSFVPATQASLLVGATTHWQAFVWQPATARWLGSNVEQRRLRL